MKKILLLLALVNSAGVLAQSTLVQVNPIEHVKKLQHEIDFRIAADKVFSDLQSTQESYELEKEQQYTQFEQCQQLVCKFNIADALIQNEMQYSKSLQAITAALESVREEQLKRAVNSLSADLNGIQEELQSKGEVFLKSWSDIRETFNLSFDADPQSGMQDLTAEQLAELESAGLELSAQMFEIETFLSQIDLIQADLHDYELTATNLNNFGYQLGTKSKRHSTDARKLAARKALAQRQSSSAEHNQQLYAMIGTFSGYTSSSGIDGSLLNQLGNMITGERKVVTAKLAATPNQFDVSLFQQLHAFVDRIKTSQEGDTAAK